MKGNNKYKRTKLACFASNLSTAAVFVLPPLLFVTFREAYGISYTLLGTLVVLNYCTQLAIDLVFSFFARFFNISRTLRLMPLLTSAGLFIYALVPYFFPRFAYAGLAAGTVIFSLAAGLAEVLVSPVIAALPSDNHERDMSALHSLYAYGILGVILISTAFLYFFGSENRLWLILFFACLPVVSHILFCISPLPDINMGDKPDASAGASSAVAADSRRRRRSAIILFVFCIFFGSASENVMTVWVSGYAETALGISKMWGDIFGMAAFAVMLGLARTLYSKYGRSIRRVMLAGMAGAILCYLVAGLSGNTYVSLAACVMCGLCTSMLWPGTLIMMEEHLPGMGVAAYALMAASGDFGASVAPQILGVVVDAVSTSELGAAVGSALSLTPEQVGLKAGFIIAAAFPIAGVAVLLVIGRRFGRYGDKIPSFK